jgi:UDP-N-acetylglucosamine--N-acetylmuramyl-(pentapeptide) pyrophosphoryl-undecaprenol N-acetylglucosamine transferase
MLNAPRILFCGGGSVGHLAPSIAVMERVRETNPDAHYFFLCARNARDEQYLRSEELPFTALPYLRLSPMLPVHLLQSIIAVRKIFRAFRPTVIFCKGGSIGIVAAIFAKFSHIPVLLHESDAVMGRANRFTSKFATTVCLGFPPNNSPFSILNSQWIYTGNPVRKRTTKGDRYEGLRITGFSGGKPVLLVMGGSQGAQDLNEILHVHLSTLLTRVDIIHLTGHGKEIAGAMPGYFPLRFATRELPHLYAITSLAISRAGAGSIAELSACCIPAVLVPLRGVAQDHQEKNARQAAHAGGFIVKEQEELRRELPSLIEHLLSENTLAEMKEHFSSRGTVNSAEHLASLLQYP